MLEWKEMRILLPDFNFFCNKKKQLQIFFMKKNWFFNVRTYSSLFFVKYLQVLKNFLSTLHYA